MSERVESWRERSGRAEGAILVGEKGCKKDQICSYLLRKHLVSLAFHSEGRGDTVQDDFFSSCNLSRSSRYALSNVTEFEQVVNCCYARQ